MVLIRGSVVYRLIRLCCSCGVMMMHVGVLSRLKVLVLLIDFVGVLVYRGRVCPTLQGIRGLYCRMSVCLLRYVRGLL